MERIPGFRWSEKENLGLKGRGFSDDDIASLLGGSWKEDERTPYRVRGCRSQAELEAERYGAGDRFG
jgi:hypothetical protein